MPGSLGNRETGNGHIPPILWTVVGSGAAGPAPWTTQSAARGQGRGIRAMGHGSPARRDAGDRGDGRAVCPVAGRFVRSMEAFVPCPSGSSGDSEPKPRNMAPRFSYHPTCLWESSTWVHEPPILVVLSSTWVCEPPILVTLSSTCLWESSTRVSESPTWVRQLHHQSDRTGSERRVHGATRLGSGQGRAGRGLDGRKETWGGRQVPARGRRRNHDLPARRLSARASQAHPRQHHATFEANVCRVTPSRSPACRFDSLPVTHPGNA